MNIIYLAAGKGSRFGKKTKVSNKCLIKFNGKDSIINYLIKNSNKLNFKKTFVITGFNEKKLRQKIPYKKINYIFNKNFSDKDMMHSLILGLKKSQDNSIISYSDIIYSNKILKKLIQKDSKKIIVPVNKNWKKIWKIRKKYHLDDAESLIYNSSKKLLEIGKKIKKDPVSQFMGLIYIPKIKIKTILKEYKKINQKKIQVTQFLNNLIMSESIYVLETKSFWYEFDDNTDLKEYEKFFNRY